MLIKKKINDFLDFFVWFFTLTRATAIHFALFHLRTLTEEETKRRLLQDYDAYLLKKLTW